MTVGRPKGCASDFRAVVRAGYAMIALSCLTVAASPARMGPLAPGMHIPNVAFQLATSAEQVEAMFGAPGSRERAAYRAQMDVANAIDYAFMLGYGAFLFSFARALSRRGVRGGGASLALSVVAPLADAVENVQLLAITAALGGGYARQLDVLAWSTWLKWFALALYPLPTLGFLWSAGRAGRAAAILGACALCATLTARMCSGSWADVMSLVVSAVVVALFWVAAQQRSRDARADLPAAPR